MNVNPHKFQAMILQSSKNRKHFEPIKLEIKKAKTEVTNIVKLLGITIDDTLNFQEHISEPCKKISMLLNAVSSS